MAKRCPKAPPWRSDDLLKIRPELVHKIADHCPHQLAIERVSVVLLAGQVAFMDAPAIFARTRRPSIV